MTYLKTWMTRRGFVMPVSTSEDKVKPAVVTAAVANLWSLGYAPSADLVKNWLDGDADETTKTLTEVLDVCTEAVGAHRLMQPFYPNFPSQVAKASDVELFVNALLHYAGDIFGVRIVPVYEKKARPKLKGEPAERPLRLGSDQIARDCVSDLLAQNAGMGAADVTALRELMNENTSMVLASIPVSVSNRENLAHITAAAMGHGPMPTSLRSQFVSATDVLRLAVALSGGDVSLAADSKFVSFPRPVRRELMSLLDGCSDLSMASRSETFKRLGERLHPGSMSGQYPKAAAAFSDLRSGVRPETVLTRIDRLVQKSLTAKAADELAKARPGELARRLDHLLRENTGQSKKVLKSFEACVPQVSTRVLLSVLAHFESRCDDQRKHRLFFPKGNVARAQVIDDERRSIPAALCTQVVAVVRAELTRRFSELDDMGKVWIDPTLDRVAVPLTIRNASPGLRTIGRGSRLPLDVDDSIQRAFMWWMDQSNGYDGRVDLDLSMMLVDDDFTTTQEIAYYNLRGVNAVHSGDFTSAPAPDGAAEFIDLDTASAARSGWRYAAVTVTSYTGQSFGTLEGAFAGVQGRRDSDSGEVFEPSQVDLRFDICSDSTFVIPFVIDLKTNEMVWIDMSIRPNARFVNALAGNRASMKQVLRGVVESSPASLGELYRLHAQGRGEIVTDRDAADVVIASGGDIDPFDTANVLSRWVV